MVLIFPLAVSARIGVGMGTGEIRIDKALKPGGIYEFPSLSITNTGDEPGYYTLGIAYHVDRPELRPPKEWFSFSPDKFYLEAGQQQRVAVKLTLPVKTEPGEYFNYVEAFPVIEKEGGTSMGVAVGARLFFTVVPANLWQAFTWRVSTFWTNNSPWTWVVLGMVLAAIIVLLFKRFFSFQLGVKKK